MPMLFRFDSPTARRLHNWTDSCRHCLLDKKTGFECHHTEARELIDTYPEVQFGRQWTYGLVFVWSGNFMEMRAAWMAAAAYARAAGVSFSIRKQGRFFRQIVRLKLRKTLSAGCRIRRRLFGNKTAT